MKTRFMVLRSGAEPRIYKFRAEQANSITAALWAEDLRLFDNLSEAKAAAIKTVSRYGDLARGDDGATSFKSSANTNALKRNLSRLTEDEIGFYPIPVVRKSSP